MHEASIYGKLTKYYYPSSRYTPQIHRDQVEVDRVYPHLPHAPQELVQLLRPGHVSHTVFVRGDREEGPVGLVEGRS